MPKSFLGGVFLLAIAVFLFLSSYFFRLYLKKKNEQAVDEEIPVEKPKQPRKYNTSVITEDDVGKRVYIVRKK